VYVVRLDGLNVILKETDRALTVMVEGMGQFPLRLGSTPAGAAERSRMWFLIMVLLNGVPGFDKITVLQTYGTFQECQIERNRIGYEMAAAYPYDRDFVIACQLDRKHDS
jgi:hypothetical protein